MLGWLDSGAEKVKGPTQPSGPDVSPLSIATYRWLWIATIVANVGTCMKDVGTGWLMTSLSASPILVASVQVATMLPMAALSLPSGALADIVDRRTFLLVAQLFAMISAFALFMVTLLGTIDPWILLCLTFAAACGSALSLPALQAINSELVPHSALAHTVTLSGISNNIARIVGPSAGGILIAFAGAEWVFLANALTTLGIIFVLRRWKRKVRVNCLPPEHLMGAIRAGFRYVHSSAELHSVMVRSIGFFLCASALWSLLPLVAREQLDLGPAGYGLLLSFIGVGAIAGALSLPWLRARLAVNELSKGASFTLAVAVATVGLAGNLYVALASMLVVGAAWNMMTANLQSTTLVETAGWAKARAFGIYLMVFQGSMAAGSFLWGAIAAEIGIANTMLVAAGLLAANLVLAAIYPIIFDSTRDFRPSRHFPEPHLEQPLQGDEGPVLVTIEYQVDLVQSDEFIRRLYKMRAVRLRDGAMRWRYWRDVSRHDLIFETFIVESWIEHLRQHERFTNADRILHDAVRELHVGTSPPLVRHWIAIP